MHSLYFIAPKKVEIREEKTPQNPLCTLFSAISAGTELLIYRGQFTQGIPADTSISTLSKPLAYPLQYGYSCVGTNASNDAFFSFHSHATHFDQENATPIPQNIPPETYILMPNTETALSLMMDARITTGERVIVFGQGIVGLLLTALISKTPLEKLTTIDKYALRRDASVKMGAYESFEATESGDYDLAIELTGNPAVLEEAIRAVGYGGRVLVGSWYGTKTAPIQLSDHFHRNHIQIITSQVSTLAPQWLGRWTKSRRWQWAEKMLSQIDVTPLITHRIPFEEAGRAYQLLDQHPDQAIQIILTYGDM